MSAYVLALSSEAAGRGTSVTAEYVEASTGLKGVDDDKPTTSGLTFGTVGVVFVITVGVGSALSVTLVSG